MIKGTVEVIMQQVRERLNSQDLQMKKENTMADPGRLICRHYKNESVRVKSEWLRAKKKGRRKPHTLTNVTV